MTINKVDILINEEIKDIEIRLIESDGSMVGVVQLTHALQLAATKNLDLVKIVPKATPPVCKIMDFGKYLFELAKKEKESKKAQKNVSIKEVRISPSIDDHDFNFKLKNASKFLEDGDKVKVSVKFRGREIHYSLLGEKVLNKFYDLCKDICVIEKKPKLEGKSMTMILSPKP